MASILIVEDERPMRRVLALFLGEQGHEVSEAESGEAALELAQRRRFDVVLLDVSLPGINGLETLRRLRDKDPAAGYVIITAYGTIRSAVDAMQAGAFNYVQKPFDNDELLLTINRALELQRLGAEVESLRHELASRYGFTDIIGHGPAMREVFSLMCRVAPTDVTVLILGESGTGKELVARAIHQKSPRASGPFVAVNCSAIPSSLVETEFFGHERGAFTDARDSHSGKFEQAHRGTIFLDEVGDLALEAQAKLLRVLQDRIVTRVGAERGSPMDVRVIAATNHHLEAAVASGRFRGDLYWRLNVMTVKLPALRERPEDLPALIDHLLERTNRELGTKVTAIAPEASRLLHAYEWPGNVRELENALRRALVLADGPTLRVADLPPRVQSLGGDPGKTPVMPEGGGSLTLAAAVTHATARIERAMIQATLSECDGNRTATAASLGINRRTLFNKMRLYGLTSEDEHEEDHDRA
jgi:DNA-binding NtrC family response regulator